jgi:hypothetical protein
MQCALDMDMIGRQTSSGSDPARPPLRILVLLGGAKQILGSVLFAWLPAAALSRVRQG